MNPLEWIAAGLGLVNVALLVRRSVWNYPFGIAMVALYIVVFYGAKLYAEAGLQLFFIAAQVWGWVLWVRASARDAEPADAADQVPVRWLSNLSRAVWALATAALALNLGWLLHRFTDAAVPYVDSAITGASVTAQLLLAFRRIENWVLWIAIDCASIAVYIYKGLYPTAGLYLVLLGLSVAGLVEWVRASRQAGEPAA